MNLTKTDTLKRLRLSHLHSDINGDSPHSFFIAQINLTVASLLYDELMIPGSLLLENDFLRKFFAKHIDFIQ